MQIISHLPRKKILSAFLVLNLIILCVVLIGSNDIFLFFNIELYLFPIQLFVFYTQFYRYYYTVLLTENDLSFKRFFSPVIISYSRILVLTLYGIPYRDGTIHEWIKIKTYKHRIKFCIEHLQEEEKQYLTRILTSKTNLTIIEKKGHL